MEVRKRFENDKLKKLQIFNGAQLKYIAFISMLIDHVNNALMNQANPFILFVIQLLQDICIEDKHGQYSMSAIQSME